jgi:hypothetical protein
MNRPSLMGQEDLVEREAVAVGDESLHRLRSSRAPVPRPGWIAGMLRNLRRHSANSARVGGLRILLGSVIINSYAGVSAWLDSSNVPGSRTEGHVAWSCISGSGL